MKNKIIPVIIFYLISMIAAFVWEQHQFNKLENQISNYKLILSAQQPDSVVINSVRCNQRNVRYVIDTTNQK